MSAAVIMVALPLSLARTLGSTLGRSKIIRQAPCFCATSSSRRECGRLFSASSGGDLVVSTIDEGAKVATLTMNRPPVNSLSLEMCQAISEGIKTIEKEKQVQGLVLCSSSPATFCAGLDFSELYKPDPSRLNDFWSAFQQVYIDLYGSRLACIAAIQGHAPAAGCMLAMACDYRIMKGESSAKIGVNEAAFGLVAPPWMGRLLLNTVGHRQGELAMSLGLLYSSESALQLGLVDELVVENGDETVLQKAQDEAAKWSKIPPQARMGSKMLARKRYLEEMKATRQQDLESFCSFVQNDTVQQGLEAYLKSLKNKKS